MKIGSFPTSPPAAADRERAAHPVATGPAFGRMLADGATRIPMRYDASPSAATHGFDEMPIVAPAHIDHISEPVATAPDGRDSGLAGEKPLLASAGQPVDAIGTGGGSDGVRMVPENGIITTRAGDRPTNPGKPAALSAPPTAATISKNAPMESAQAKRAGPVMQQAALRAPPGQTLPFAVHAVRASRGAIVSISAGSLSEDEQNELAAQARDMGRSLGIEIEEVRISGFKGRK